MGVGLIIRHQKILTHNLLKNTQILLQVVTPAWYFRDILLAEVEIFTWIIYVLLIIVTLSLNDPTSKTLEHLFQIR